MSNWQALKTKLETETKPSKEQKEEKRNKKKKRKHDDIEHNPPITSSHKRSKKEPRTLQVSTSTSAPARVSSAVETIVSRTKSLRIGKYLALDCEMVGTNAPPHGSREVSTLARISVVNYHGHVIYDSYVAPPTGHKITDYRTWVSGIEPHHLYKAPTFEHVQDHVKSLLKGRILVGHALINDFKALRFTHPKHMVRDTCSFPKFRDYATGRTPGLKKVAHMELGIKIQGAQHSSVEDARACMALYRKYKADFEQRAAQRVLGG